MEYKITLSHPCKKTCSGWKQGKEEGRREAILEMIEAFKECGKNHPEKTECDETAEVIASYFASELKKAQ